MIPHDEITEPGKRVWFILHDGRHIEARLTRRDTLEITAFGAGPTALQIELRDASTIEVTAVAIE